METRKLWSLPRAYRIAYLPYVDWLPLSPCTIAMDRLLFTCSPAYVCLPLCVCLPASERVYAFLPLNVCMPVCLSVCLSVCLCACLPGVRLWRPGAAPESAEAARDCRLRLAPAGSAMAWEYRSKLHQPLRPSGRPRQHRPRHGTAHGIRDTGHGIRDTDTERQIR